MKIGKDMSIFGPTSKRMHWKEIVTGKPARKNTNVQSFLMVHYTEIEF